jgi:hypothetical protein
MAVLTALFLGLDWFLRERLGHGGLAPRASDLWLSVALGTVLGAVALLWDRYQLRNQRGYLLAVHQAPLGERLTWRFQRTNLLPRIGIFLALLALIGWCVHAGVLVLPALFALNAVEFAGNRKLAGQLNEELQQRSAA